MNGWQPLGVAARAVGLTALVCGAVVLGGHRAAGAAVIPTPAPADKDAVVAELARAAVAQGICYGWRLSDGARVVSRGSNLGADVAVDSDLGRCPRWIELRATVVWTPESSESEDSATRELVSSADLATALLPGPAALERVGVTEKALIDDPAETVLVGVLAVPLLVAERGLAPPVPVRTSATTPNPAALADTGSDFWRDRGVPVGIAIGLIVVALGVVGVGWRATRRSGQMERARRIGLGDLVHVRGQTWAVRGSIRCSDGPRSWVNHLLDDADRADDTDRADEAKRWLSVAEGQDTYLTLWTELPGATVRPRKDTVEFDGRRYLLEGKGKAAYTASGTTGRDQTGTMRYRRYEAADGALLSLEAYGDSKQWVVARGKRLRWSELTIHRRTS